MCCFRNFSLYCFFNQGKGACFQYYWPVIKPGRRGDRNQSLRHSMALCAMKTAKDRLDKLKEAPASADVVQDCIRFNLIDQNRMMPYLRWDAGQKQMVPSKEKPLPIGEVSRILDTIVQILQSEPEITLRFHALSKLQSEDNSGKTIPFLWTVGHRTQGELWNLLRTVSFHSIWQLVRLTLRPQTQQRTALAKQLGKMM